MRLLVYCVNSDSDHYHEYVEYRDDADHRDDDDHRAYDDQRYDFSNFCGDVDDDHKDVEDDHRDNEDEYRPDFSQFGEHDDVEFDNVGETLEVDAEQVFARRTGKEPLAEDQ